VEESHTVIEGATSATSSAIPLAHGTILAGRYEIRRLLGRGGAGIVMQAHDRVLGEDVAVKVLRPEHGDETRWIERLAREVKLARQIRHANVCRVFDFGQGDGHAFLVMELAAANSLRSELAPGGAVARPRAARLADARAVAEGLAAIHAAGIVHRDITPQNVLRMSDGRLVVSDFGLATDADPTASSIHGGTVAYMAPEVARGEPASLASDIWALGIIIHEIVFGARPCWREGRFGATITSAQDGALGLGERRLVEICQRCSHERARHRPTAAQVADWLASADVNGRPGAVRPALPRHALLGVLGLALAAGVVAVSARRAPLRLPGAAVPSLTAAFTGEAEDWTVSARVLTTVGGRIDAITALPGGRRVRMTWGDPRRVEDVDLASGARTVAVVPPVPGRAGPAVVSPDGKALAVEGYAAEGRPFIFLGAASPDAQPVPVSAAADPSLASEPRWLAGSRAFVYDADMRNVGVFSLDTNRATILPTFDARPSYTTFKAAVFDRILVARIAEGGTSQLGIFAWPSTELVFRVDLPAFAVEWQSGDGRKLFGIAFEHDRGSELVELSLAAREARRLAHVPGQSLRALALVGGDLVFASDRYGGDLWIDAGDGGRVVTHDLGAREVARGGGHVLVSTQEKIIELDEAGQVRGPLTAGPRDETPSILPDGRAWTYVRRAGDAPGLYRCAFGGACARLSDTIMPYATLSPDGTRVAYVDPEPSGPRARVVALAGGAAHDVGDASSYCRPVWSGPHTLWISRRAAGTPEWVEVDVDAPEARPTGRTRGGARDCSDGLPDPAAPMRDGVKIVIDWRSELRVHAAP
jgi:Protein kinase domain